MNKLPFSSDYTNLCHPEILRRLSEIADEPFLGYGKDEVCDSARRKIREACNAPNAEIHFLIGGTQTNVIAIDALLKPYQGVLCAETAHINVHEAGAVEATGHKVLTLPQTNGKVTAENVDHYIQSFYSDDTWDHMVQPGLLYITLPTELGTLYSLEELKEIASVCSQNDIKLYIDGARLGYGLMATESDVTLPDVAQLADAFYIGGTKVGALMGEAIVFPKPHTVSHFFTQIKRHNSLLAKGWILGVQFDTLFTNDLYFNISRQAIQMAKRLKSGLIDKGYELYIDSPTNQQFVILPNSIVERISEKVACEIWSKLPNNQSAVRLCTSWHTTQEEVDQLINLL